MYAMSGSAGPLRIELGGMLLLVAATAAPQPSGTWKGAHVGVDCLTYLRKLSRVFRTWLAKLTKHGIAKAGKLI